MVLRGPDLHSSRSPLDRKLYRTLLLPNGIECLLVQDTMAMHQQQDDESYDDDSDEGSSSCDSGDSDQDSKEENTGFQDGGGTGIRDAAVAVVVGAGSLMDPLHCQGVAHFLEHLLFMGSEKYPDENEYEEYVAKHGGSDNAWTDWECTNYHFRIAQPYLFGALDRLAQFFIAPLLLEDCVDRELRAVESEFQLQKNNDSSRLDQLRCSTFDKTHPFCRFSWGNYKSIHHIPHLQGIDKMKELRAFYNRYYYGANMRVVVIGAYSLDVLEQKIVESFGPVPALPRDNLDNANLPVDSSKIGKEFLSGQYRSPFRNAGMPWTGPPKIFRLVPVKERYTLSISWPLPPQLHHWQTKPTDFLAHLLGHEASGSIFAYVREKSWATSLVAGVEDDGHTSSHSLFSVTFTLSREGMEHHWKDLIGITYQYIGMLKQYKGNWPEWIHQELKTIQEVSYMYADEQDPEEFVEEMAENMAPHYLMPMERILDGFSLLFAFDGGEIDELLQLLTPERARIDIVSSFFGASTDYDTSVEENSLEIIPSCILVEEERDFFDKNSSTPQLEPMFGASFWCHKVPDCLIADWLAKSESGSPESLLHLPSQNKFVPDSYELKERPRDDADHPLNGACIKVCIPVGKSKQWFPATVLRFDQTKNSLLLSYEDQDERWHTIDGVIPWEMKPDFAGTFDQKRTKFRLISLSRYQSISEQNSNGNSFDHLPQFPSIPPATNPSRLPKLTYDDSLLKMWFLQDRVFNRPIAEFRFQVICQHANVDPLYRACADLLVELCLDACVETTYLACVAELGCTIEATDYGFYFRYHGFDNKLMELFKATFPLLLDFRELSPDLPSKFSHSRFESCKEMVLRRYHNSDMTVSKMSSSVRLRTLRMNSWSPDQKAVTLRDVEVGTFREVVSHVLSKFSIECLLHGNVDKDECISTRKSILDLVNDGGKPCGLPRKQYPTHSVLRLPQSDTIYEMRLPSKDPSDPNTSVEVYFQVGKESIRDRVLMELLLFMMDEPFYAEVRTKDQFGYNVHCNDRWTYGIVGCIFKIVTNVKSAAESVNRIDKFLDDFRKQLVSMNERDYKEHLIGLATQKLDAFNSLSETTDAYWGELRDGRFAWESHRDEAEVLKDISKIEAIAAFDRWLCPGKLRRAMAIQIIGRGTKNGSEVIPDLKSEEHLLERYTEEINCTKTYCKKEIWGRVNSKLF